MSQRRAPDGQSFPGATSSPPWKLGRQSTLPAAFDAQPDSSHLLESNMTSTEMPYDVWRASDRQCGDLFPASEGLARDVSSSELSLHPIHPTTSTSCDIFPVATLIQDEAEDDLVYKVYNDRDNVLAFVSQNFPTAVIRNGGLDFDQLKGKLFSSQGFYGSKDCLVEFLKTSFPDVFHFFTSASRTAGIYCLTRQQTFTLFFWPGSIQFSSSTSPILTFTRILLELCQEVTLVISHSISSQFCKPQRREGAIRRKFQPKTRDVTQDGFEIVQHQQLSTNLSHQESSWILSPEGSKFGLLEVKKEVDKLKPLTVKFRALEHHFVTHRFCFNDLSDFHFEQFIDEARKFDLASIKSLINKFDDSLKVINRQK
ncbi:hypothetical protein P9112_001863 [Eukaryota sp. TZLM1-RC]